MSGSVEHDCLVAVAENTPVEVPPDGAGQNEPLEIAATCNEIVDLVAMLSLIHI